MYSIQAIFNHWFYFLIKTNIRTLKVNKNTVADALSHTDITTITNDTLSHDLISDEKKFESTSIIKHFLKMETISSSFQQQNLVLWCYLN